MKFTRCIDCHRPHQEGYYLADPGQRISITVRTGGLVKEKAGLESYFSEKYESRGFALSGDQAAGLNVMVDLKVAEVFDRTLFPNQALRLFKGICELTIQRNEEMILNTTISSKVISTLEEDNALGEISQYLSEQALIASFVAFSETF